MERYLHSQVRKDLEKKIVLLSGPRQAGKTTLAKALWPKTTEYLNFDRAQDRRMIREESWKKNAELVVFDELHKMRDWKRWIKGIFDTDGVRPRLLVTGSARMDYFRKGGESLAGRHFSFRLHPISVAEAINAKVLKDAGAAQERLLKIGGFPDPFLAGSEDEAQRWRSSHLDRILREDLIDLERVREIRSIELLVDLLSERVGSTVSYSSLARDLEVSPKTVKHWVEILERMFVVFTVKPYSRNITRSLLKEPKIYFYDTGRVLDRGGARLENLVACALLKRNHYQEDTRGEKRDLCYVRDQQKREVDFLTLKGRDPEWLVDVKESDDTVSSSLAYFAKRISGAKAIQCVKNLRREKQFGDIEVRNSAEWLRGLV